MIELIDKPGTLFRVGRQFDSRGLWYDADGKEHREIDTIEGALARDLPMGPHPYFRAFKSRWISVTDSLPGLCDWFSVGDCLQLAYRGFNLLRIRTERYAKFDFKDFGYSHEVFRMDDVVDISVLDFWDWIRSRQFAGHAA